MLLHVCTDLLMMSFLAPLFGCHSPIIVPHFKFSNSFIVPFCNPTLIGLPCTPLHYKSPPSFFSLSHALYRLLLASATCRALYSTSKYTLANHIPVAFFTCRRTRVIQVSETDDPTVFEYSTYLVFFFTRIEPSPVQTCRLPSVCTVCSLYSWNTPSPTALRLVACHTIFDATKPRQFHLARVYHTVKKALPTQAVRSSLCILVVAFAPLRSIPHAQ